MNWFQRYSIPAAYLFTLISILFFINIYAFDITIPDIKDYIPAIGAFFAISLLPLGYFLIIFGQLIYYTRSKRNFLHFHKKWWHSEEENDPEAPIDEIAAETKLIILPRIEKKYSKKSGNDEMEFEKAKWLQEYYSKRIDVLAINTANMMVTILITVADIIFALLYLLEKLCFLLWNGIIVILLFLVLCVFYMSYQKIKKQIIDVDEAYLKWQYHDSTKLTSTDEPKSKKLTKNETRNKG